MNVGLVTLWGSTTHQMEQRTNRPTACVYSHGRSMWILYIYLHFLLIFMASVGKYTSVMDPSWDWSTTPPRANACKRDGWALVDS